jgi:hypothetical protein
MNNIEVITNSNMFFALLFDLASSDYRVDQLE